MAVTLDSEMSPRKVDVVGVKGIVEMLAKDGKLTRRGPKAGQPLSLSAVSLLTVRDPTFPKPWSISSARRFWRRADVEKWLPTWEQRDGPKGGSRKADLLVMVIDGKPDHVWTVHDLVAKVGRDKVFAETGNLRRAVWRITAAAVQEGRIERVGPGRFRSLNDA